MDDASVVVPDGSELFTAAPPQSPIVTDEDPGPEAKVPPPRDAKNAAPHVEESGS